MFATLTGTSTATGRAQAHVTTLALLNIVFATVLGSAGLLAWLGLGPAALAVGAPTLAWVPNALVPAAAFVLVTSAVVAVPAALAALGLVRRQEWGRSLALVVAGFIGLAAVATLTFVPLAYAGYASWALTQPEVAGLFSPSSGGG